MQLRCDGCKEAGVLDVPMAISENAEKFLCPNGHEITLDQAEALAKNPENVMKGSKARPPAKVEEMAIEEPAVAQEPIVPQETPNDYSWQGPGMDPETGCVPASEESPESGQEPAPELPKEVTDYIAETMAIFERASGSGGIIASMPGSYRVGIDTGIGEDSPAVAFVAEDVALAVGRVEPDGTLSVVVSVPEGYGGACKEEAERDGKSLSVWLSDQLRYTLENFFIEAPKG